MGLFVEVKNDRIMIVDVIDCGKNENVLCEEYIGKVFILPNTQQNKDNFPKMLFK